MSEIRDETEVTKVVICNERSYEVPRDVANRIIELEEKLEKTDNENCKLLKEQFDLKNRVAELEDMLQEALERGWE